ncbi:UPF0481 protein [Salix suchowensis]|nr:UPF0481 protein [Salix suchowensis]
MQKQVLSLYRGFLRATRSKSPEDRREIESFVSAKFRRNSKQVDRKNFIYIEYLLRREGILEDIKAYEAAHFVDLVRKCQKPSEPNTPKALESINMPSVTELHQAGVKFKLSPSKSLLDMKFDGGILEIPPLRVQDNTGIYFRNLQAFE